MSKINPERITVRVPSDLLRELKIVAIEEDKTVSGIAGELLIGYVRRKRKLTTKVSAA